MSARGPTQAARRWILAASILGSAVVFLDGTVVNVALPRIGRDLPSHLLGTLEGQTYVYTGYLLSLSAFLVVAGAVSDIYGRRRTFLIGLAGFGATSLLCGLAPNLEALIAFRVLQGLAGALLVPGSLALLRVNFEGPEQGRAYGLWAAGTSLVTLAGPFAGGVLVDAISWRAVFFVNVPVVALAMYATARHVPESYDEDAPKGLDWVGAVLFGLAAGGLAFGTIWEQARAWRSPLGWVAIALGVGAVAVLPFWLRRARHPLVPPDLFRSRNFTVVNIATLVIYGGLYVSGYYQPLFLQGVSGYSAAAAGLAGVPGAVFLILLSPRAGRMSSVVGPRPFLVAGPLLMMVAVLWLARIPQAVSYPVDVLPASIVFGLGVGLMVTPLTNALMSSVAAAHAGVASAFNNAISRVGPQLSGALVFVFVSAVFYAQLGARPGGVSPINRPADPHWIGPAAAASTSSFHVAMLVCAGLFLAGALINLVGLEGRPEPAAAAGREAA